MPKITIINNKLDYLVKMRKPLLRELAAHDWQVTAIGPFDGAESELTEMGVECIDISLSRVGIDPLGEIRTIVELVRILRQVNPEAVLLYTSKPIIYGVMAAKWVGIERIISINTGLGHVFIDQSVKTRMLRILMLLMYRLAFAASDAVMFHNAEDMEYMIGKGSVSKSKARRLPGSGVDLTRFTPSGEQPAPGTFILVGRLLWSKGVGTYVKAARTLKQRYPETEFKLLGYIDDNPAMIQKEQIAEWEREGIVKYLGSAEDVRPFLDETSVFVLPSFREGLSRAILEAMAMAKPIVTTDAPGCRETVVEGENGFIVPVDDARKLAAAMEHFIEFPDDVSTMGKRSREIAGELYDVNIVTSMMLEELGG